MQNMKKCILLLLILGFVTGCVTRPKRKFYSIFRTNEMAGVNLYGKETSVQGFTDDLLFEIASIKDIRLKINTVEQGKTAALLNIRGADGVIGLVNSKLRDRKSYNVSDPYFSFGPVVVMRVDEKLLRVN